MPIQEYTKEQIVLLFFLTHGNEWSNVDPIWKWARGEMPGASIGVLNESGQISLTLSRAGAAKICKRLVPTVLESMTTTGYRSKKVILYRLAEHKDGFLSIVQRMKNSLIIFMESQYGQKGVEEYLIKFVEKTNEVDFGDNRGIVEWAFRHSPTALLLGVEGHLVDPNDSEEMNLEQRVNSCMATLACAIRVDMAIKNRRKLLQNGNEMDYFRSLLSSTD